MLVPLSSSVALFLSSRRSLTNQPSNEKSIKIKPVWTTWGFTPTSLMEICPLITSSLHEIITFSTPTRIQSDSTVTLHLYLSLPGSHFFPFTSRYLSMSLLSAFLQVDTYLRLHKGILTRDPKGHQSCYLSRPSATRESCCFHVMLNMRCSYLRIWKVY